jgi:hypothetical protein
MPTKEAISNLAFGHKPVGTSFFGTNFVQTGLKKNNLLFPRNA